MNNPALWAKGNAISRCCAEDFSKEFQDEIGKMSGRCIDIGAGPCDVVVDFVLPKLDPKATMTCADISDDMLKFAKKEYEGNNRLSFLKLDIETPNLPKDLIEQFDHATSFHCLHWCKDKRRVFENIFNLLRPGGTLLLSSICKYPGLMESFDVLASMPCYQPYMKDMDLYMPTFEYPGQSYEAMKTLIKNVGFEIHHCSTRTRNFIFETPKLLSVPLMAISPFTDRMPPNVKREFEKDITREYARRCIIFNKNNDNEDEYSVLSIHDSIIVYLRKPLVKKNSNM